MICGTSLSLWTLCSKTAAVSSRDVTPRDVKFTVGQYIISIAIRCFSIGNGDVRGLFV